jgi:DNA repair protein SbcD/Mre11
VADDVLRLLHVADLHLGVQSGGRIDPATGLNRRIVDVCERFDELCARACDDGVHAVLFAGDAFNNQHPNPTLQSLFASRVRRLAKAGTAVFLLIGNHDLPRMASLAHPFSIYEALEVDGVVVGDRARVYRLPLRDAPAPELQVAALPHFSKHQVLARFGENVDIDEAIANTIRGLGEGIDPSLPAVFVGHCHVNQADLGEGPPLFGVSDVEVSLSTLTSGQPFGYFALGHIHKRQVLHEEPFVAYPGSLERMDFGEGERVDVASDGTVARRAAEPKGFYRFDLAPGDWTLAGEPTFVEVAARRYVTLRLGDLDAERPSDDIAARVTHARSSDVRFDDAFVRVTGSVETSDRARVSSAAVRDAIPEAYDVVLALESRSATLVRDPRFAQRMSETQALDRYIETRADWADDAEELRRLGRQLIDEVLEA